MIFRFKRRFHDSDILFKLKKKELKRVRVLCVLMYVCVFVLCATKFSINA